MGTNGSLSPEEYAQRVRDADRSLENLRCEHARVADLIESWEQHRSDLLGSAERAGVRALAEQGVKRSLLTARQKSDLINQIGKAAYDQIPW